MFTYIKESIIGKYINSDVLIDELQGYEGTVGTDWKDYLDGKFLLLSEGQLQFKKENPEASVEEVWNMEIIIPPTPPVHERTLDDAKMELHEAAEVLSDELRVFYVDNVETWFSDRPSVNLQIDAEAFDGAEFIELYDDNGNHVRLPVSEAKNMIMAIERYDNRCKVFIRNLHSMIDTIPSLEVADAIDVKEYKSQAPETPTFTTEPQPTAETYYVYYKLLNAHADNDITAVTANDCWKSTVFPDDGYALLRTDFTAEMGAKPIDVYFEEDKLGRKEYASSAKMEIQNVTGDISIVTIGRNE